MMVRVTHRSLGRIFAAPLVIAIVSIAGLISALVGDGWWDAFSWGSLGLPVLLCLYFLGRRQPR
jgi:membrane protein required for beta-lactamase induction